MDFTVVRTAMCNYPPAELGPDSGSLPNEAREAGRLSFDEAALYGAQVHVVVPDARENQPAIEHLLHSAHIPVNSIVWIAPTLEDVFISAVSKP